MAVHAPAIQHIFCVCVFVLLLSYIAKMTINPAVAHGMSHVIGSIEVERQRLDIDRH